MGNSSRAPTTAIHTKCAQSMKTKHHIQIKVEIYGDVKYKTVVIAAYSQEETLHDIFRNVIDELEDKHHPKKFQINWLGDKSFTRQYVLNEPITKYNRKEIITKGLLIQMKVYYEHKICNEFISCPMMKTSESENPSKCPIYSAMQKECQLNQENLDHLDEHSHFKNEYEQKPECKQGQQCKPFIRLENGGNGIADRCHLKLFRHPPRTRNIELAKNIKSFIFNKQKKANHALHKPSNDRGDWKHHTMLRGFLKLLIDEVICNGYKGDLCMKCSN
eukprot:33290_1